MLCYIVKVNSCENTHVLVNFLWRHSLNRFIKTNRTFKYDIRKMLYTKLMRKYWKIRSGFSH